VSPASESPFSEEESREFNAGSSGRSARTISSNSFCSDDTGCPSSQSVSPVKTPSDTGNSPVGFCPGSDEDFSRKKCTVGMVGEGSVQSSRYKKEPKSGLVKPGKCHLLFMLFSEQYDWSDFTFEMKHLYIRTGKYRTDAVSVPRNISLFLGR